jgi:filamentous hemagglutinin family protein
MKTLKLLGLSIHISAFFVIHLPGLASAQVMPGGFKTRVNGSAFGACASGNCAISGGSKSGPNLFHRFNYFDTRNGVAKIRLDTQGLENIIVGVTSASGTFLNKPLTLSSAANLFWLSPGGIWVGNGAMVSNVNNLLLTTAAGMKIGGKTFDIFNTRIGDVNSLQQSPDLNFGELGSPEASVSSLGLLGNGPIQFEGGQITVDRNLLVNATAGKLSTVPGYATQLHAGRSVWLTGHHIDLQDVNITAGEPGRWGLVNVVGLPFPDTTQRSSIQLDGALLKGQQLWMSAGAIALNKSSLEAPKGWIQLIANDASDPSKSLTISQSVLDVSAYGLKDLNAPVLKNDSLQIDLEAKTPARLSYPRIGLFSKGDIKLSQNTLLNASLDISTLQTNSSVDPKLDVNSLADRSGIILLRAEGKIQQNSSTVSADASNTKAGRIFFQANGINAAGGISLYDSKIYARYGAGDGEVSLQSAGGISLDNAIIDVSANRYPIVDGESYSSADSEVRPYVFQAGKIALLNTSIANSIEITNRSSLIARQDTSGGGLYSPLLGFRYDNDTTQYGTFGTEDSFSVGTSYPTISRIRLASDGGLEISNSSLDVSSGESPYENTAGVISILDRSSSGIGIIQSSLRAMAGTPRDLLNKDIEAGQIYVMAIGPISINSSSFLANNYNAADVSEIARLKYYTYPLIGIYSETSTLALRQSTLEANYNKEPFSSSIELIGNNLFPNPIINERASFDPPLLSYNAVGLSTGEIAEFRINEAKENFSTTANAYGIAQVNKYVGKNLTLSPGQVLTANPIQLNHSLPSSNSQSVSIAIDQNSASSQFLESQNRTLIQTTKALGLPSGSGKLRSIAELQQRLTLASKLAPSLDLSALPKLSLAANQFQPKSINTSTRPYTPAIVHLQRDDEASGQTRITAILLTAQGEPISRSTKVARADLDGWIKGFQRQLSRRSPLPDPTRDPGEPLAKALISPLLPLLRAQGVTALLLEVDRGLQAIPYGALPVEGRPLGDLFALTITPSLGLIELDPGQRAYRGQMLLAGASQFSNGLAPLPMVRQELQALAQEHPSQLLLDGSFTPTALIDQALGSNVNQLHIATHANFLPGQTGVLYTPTTTLSLADLGRRLRSRNSSYPLDLISMSACLTALGDEQSELGFVGMALQAGARSGLGTLWEVDDTATAAFFIELYRFLKVGLTKDQALQATQQAFRLGQVRLQGDRLVGPDPRTGQAESVLVAGLSRQEQILFAQGLNHPYYWAGMILTGSPW